MLMTGLSFGKVTSWDWMSSALFNKGVLSVDSSSLQVDEGSIHQSNTTRQEKDQNSEQHYLRWDDRNSEGIHWPGILRRSMRG